MIPKLSMFLVFLLFPLGAAAAIYRCVDAQGKIVFSDSPCATDPSRIETIDTRTGAGTGIRDNADAARTLGGADLSRWNPQPPSPGGEAALKPSDVTLQLQNDHIRMVAADADQAVTASKAGLVQVWNLGQGKLVKQYPVESGNIHSLALAGAGLIIGLNEASTEGNLQVRDLGQGTPVKHLSGQAGSIESLAVADNLIASYVPGKTVALWELTTQRLVREIPVELAGDNPTTLHVALADGLIGVSSLRTIRVWDSNTGEALARFETPGNVYALALGGGKLFAAAGSRNVLVWNPRTGEPLAPLQGHTQWVSSVTVRNGRIVSGSFDNTVQVWDLETGQLLRTLRAKDKVYEVAATADAVLARIRNVIEVWNHALK